MKLLILVLLFLPITLNAQSKLTNSVYKEAQVIKYQAPIYPRIAAERGDEGWVRLSFVVSADASIKDIQVIDHSDVDAFIRPAINAASKYQFQPATQNGIPVDSIEEIKILFQMEGKPKGASRKFASKFRLFRKAILKEDRAKALVHLKALRTIKVNNHYEYAFLNLAEYYHGLLNKDNDFVQITRLRAATRIANVEPYIPNDAWGDAMKSLFVLEARVGDYGAALDTFERIPDKKVFSDIRTKLDPFQQEIRQLRHNKTPISSKVKLNQRGFGYLDLLKPVFTVSNLDGQVDSFRLSCDSGISTVEFRLDSEYKIPESFGRCSLRIRGLAESRFDLVQLATTD